MRVGDGMSENGALATTAEDAALLLSVMADDPTLAQVAPLDERLHVAVSFRAPVAGVAVDPAWAAAADRLVDAVGEQPLQPVATADAEPALALIGVGADDLEAMLGGVVEDLVGLVLGRILLMLGRHTDVLRGASGERELWR